MTKWEYAFVEGPERKIGDLIAQLNQAGQQGWEAFATVPMKKGITADTVAFVLKRPIA